MQDNAKQIALYRSEIIEKFINVEKIMNLIISQYYFKKVRIDFLLDVLYNQYSNFALRLEIIKKILPEFDSKIEYDLRKLNVTRNYFAHWDVTLFKNEMGKPSQESYTPHPKNKDKTLDFKESYQEFIEKENGITEYLFEEYKKLGGVFIKEESN